MGIEISTQQVYLLIFVVLDNDKLQFMCRTLQEFITATTGYAFGCVLSWL